MGDSLKVRACRISGSMINGALVCRRVEVDGGAAFVLFVCCCGSDARQPVRRARRRIFERDWIIFREGAR